MTGHVVIKISAMTLSTHICLLQCPARHSHSCPYIYAALTGLALIPGNCIMDSLESFKHILRNGRCKARTLITKSVNRVIEQLIAGEEAVIELPGAFSKALSISYSKDTTRFSTLE
jgi:hypothetical protein